MTTQSLQLRVIKAVHTVIWAWFAACIVLIPWAGARNEFRTAFILCAVVGVEVVVLSANHFVCPLTNAARRYTDDTRDNFDIYLPRTLARYTKHVFGTLFVAGLLYTITRWLIYG